MKPEYFIYELDDYSSPTIVSWTKPYFGTIGDFKSLIDNLPGKSMEELRNTFERFAAGERRIVYHAGQAKIRFAHRVSLLAEKQFDLKKLTFEYKNTYGFPYKIRMTSAVGRLCLFKYEKVFYTVIWAKLERPRYCNNHFDGRRWTELGDMIWGFPGQIKMEGKFMKNALGVIEKRFDDEAAVREHFASVSEIDWQKFYEDVFGDG